MYEMKTPDMIEARDVARQVIKGLLAGTLEVKKANSITAANGDQIRSFSNDLKARLLLPKILESEAKLVETSKQPEKAIAPPSGAETERVAA